MLSELFFTMLNETKEKFNGFEAKLDEIIRSHQEEPRRRLSILPRAKALNMKYLNKNKSSRAEGPKYSMSDRPKYAMSERTRSTAPSRPTTPIPNKSNGRASPAFITKSSLQNQPTSNPAYSAFAPSNNRPIGSRFTLFKPPLCSENRPNGFVVRVKNSFKENNSSRERIEVKYDEFVSHTPLISKTRDTCYDLNINKYP